MYIGKVISPLCNIMENKCSKTVTSTCNLSAFNKLSFITELNDARAFMA